MVVVVGQEMEMVFGGTDHNLQVRWSFIPQYVQNYIYTKCADGRRDFERGGDENADEWLARQQRKLREKKASKHVV